MPLIKRTFTAVDPMGVEHSRTSDTRRYTFAVLRYQGRGWKAIAFSSRYALAQRVCLYGERIGGGERIIVPVTVTERVVIPRATASFPDNERFELHGLAFVCTAWHNTARAEADGWTFEVRCTGRSFRGSAWPTKAGRGSRSVYTRGCSPSLPRTVEALQEFVAARKLERVA